MTRRSVEQANSSLARTADGPKAIGDSLAGFLDELEHQDLSLGEIDDLVHRIEQATGDRHSRRRFQAIAQRVPRHVIERLLGDIKSAGGDLRNPGAFFEKRIQTECRALDIELPRNRQSVDPPASIPPADPSPSTPAERALE